MTPALLAFVLYFERSSCDSALTLVRRRIGDDDASRPATCPTTGRTPGATAAPLGGSGVSTRCPSPGHALPGIGREPRPAVRDGSGTTRGIDRSMSCGDARRISYPSAAPINGGYTDSHSVFCKGVCLCLRMLVCVGLCAHVLVSARL